MDHGRPCFTSKVCAAIARIAHSSAAWALSALLLVTIATCAHAASVYRCVDPHGHLTFQDTPCAEQARQRKLDLQPQPLIGAPGEHAARVAATTHHREAVTRSRKKPRHGARANPVTSWECRAADGEVFYRHTHCPGSVSGDGTVRRGYAEKVSGSRTRNRQGAWGRVPVHGEKITRAEACRRIHSAGAAGRDGHARDETVSTYDHLMGRDPCGN